MRILMVTQWFDPEPTFKGLTFAKELAKLGHEVSVLTGFPNYPQGRLYEGYSLKCFQHEYIEGIRILRVPLYPSHDYSAIRRAANYATFALSAATIGALLVKPADVAYVYHPPPTVGLSALILQLLRRIPFVYDIQDLWPDTLRATGMVNSNAVYWILDKWCRLLYRKASKIVVLSPGFKRVLCERGVPEGKIEVVYNWCEEDQIYLMNRDEALARELGMEGRFNVVFAGNIGKAQALGAVIDVAGRVETRFPQIQFVFVGDGVELNRLKQRAKDASLRNVLFLPRRPVSEISGILSLSDVLLVHLKDDPLFEITIPSKTQAYLAVGRPILMGVRGDAADLVAKARAGISCTPENSGSIAGAVEKLFTMPRQQLTAMGENGFEFYRKNLSFAIGTRRFEEIFKTASNTVQK